MKTMREYLMSLSVEEKAKLMLERKRLEEDKALISLPNEIVDENSPLTAKFNQIELIIKSYSRDMLRVCLSKYAETKGFTSSLTQFNKERNIDVILNSKLPILCITDNEKVDYEVCDAFISSLKNENFEYGIICCVSEIPHAVTTRYTFSPIKFLDLSNLVNLFL